MRINITEENKNVREYNFSKDKVVVGRGQDADIKVSNSNISREHVALYFYNDEFFVEDISKNNWVKIAGETLPKNQKKRYVENFGIELPGDIRIELEAERSFEIDSSFLESCTPTKKNKNIKHRKLNIPKTLKLDKSVLKKRDNRTQLELELDKPKTPKRKKTPWFKIILLLSFFFIIFYALFKVIRRS